MSTMALMEAQEGVQVKVAAEAKEVTLAMKLQSPLACYPSQQEAKRAVQVGPCFEHHSSLL
jgi:hypothetical protein